MIMFLEHFSSASASPKLKGQLLASLLALMVITFAGCQADQESDDSKLTKDRNATVELNRINAVLASTQPVTRLDVETLAALRTRYPNATVVRQLYQGALIKRGDWAAAEQIISSIPEPQRTTADRLNLARIHFKLGRFHDAAEVLRRIQPGDAERLEVTGLLGQALFYEGKVDEAMGTLEGVRDQLLAQKRGDDLAVLATAYSRRGDHQRAIELLQKAAEAAPENVPVLNALSRAYGAAGDAAKAESTAMKLGEVNARVAEREKKRSRLVPLFYRLEDAYAAKDYERVIALVEQLQPESDDATKPTLYQYLAAAYKAQGKEAEARRALEAAANLKKP